MCQAHEQRVRLEVDMCHCYLLKYICVDLFQISCKLSQIGNWRRTWQDSISFAGGNKFCFIFIGGRTETTALDPDRHTPPMEAKRTFFAYVQLFLRKQLLIRFSPDCCFFLSIGDVEVFLLLFVFEMSNRKTPKLNTEWCVRGFMLEN